MRNKWPEHLPVGHGELADLDLTKTSPLPASVSAPLHRRRRPPIRLHEARALAAEDRALREGIPVTSLPRTLLDLAATVRFQWLEKMVERSEDLELFDLQEDLLLVGIVMTRVTGPRLEREPREVIRRIARLLEQRRGLGLASV